MPIGVFKLFARQGTGWTDRQSGEYILPPTYIQMVSCVSTIGLLRFTLLIIQQSNNTSWYQSVYKIDK